MRVLFAYALIGGHLLCLEAELLFVSIFCSRKRAVMRSERIFLRSSRKILYFLQIALGVRVVYDHYGDPLPRQAIIVSNHQSYFDILIIRAFFPQHTLRFIAKQTLRRRFPAVSRLMRLQAHAFIERNANLFSTMAEIRRFAKRIAATEFSPVVFPEGTRAKDGVLLPFFAAGLRQLSVHLDLPIILVVVHNSYRLNRLSDLQRAPRGVSVRIEVLRCIDDAGERRRHARQITLLEQEYREALCRAQK